MCPDELLVHMYMLLPGKRQNIALLHVTYNLVGEARKLACCMYFTNSVQFLPDAIFNSTN